MKIDYNRDALIGEFAKQTLRDRYMLPEERSPQDAYARAAKAFADDEAHAQRIYDYASQQWFMFATPLLSNGGTSRGLPISCFLNYVDDSREGITEIFTEDAFLSSVGGGIGTYWGAVRSKGTKTSRGSESTGVVPFVKVKFTNSDQSHERFFINLLFEHKRFQKWYVDAISPMIDVSSVSFSSTFQNLHQMVFYT